MGHFMKTGSPSKYLGFLVSRLGTMWPGRFGNCSTSNQYCPLVAQEGGMKAASGSEKLSYAWWRKRTNKDILGRLIGHRLLLVLFLIDSSAGGGPQ